MLKIIRNLIIFFIYSILATTYANSFENKIILKVNNEIITSLDILTEFEYLQIINSEFKNIKKK
jgi:peptidyl-prolyl cis-trans isomerase SurA